VKNTTLSQIKFINRENNKSQENKIGNYNNANNLNHKVTAPGSGFIHNPKNFTNGNPKNFSGNNNNTNYNFNLKGNNFNLHQRYKSSNSELLSNNLNVINNNNNNNKTISEEEENAKIFFNNINEKNMQKFSPTISKELQLNIKTNYNLSSNIPNQFSGNFTTNNFNLLNGNKISKCNLLLLFINYHLFLLHKSLIFRLN